MSPRLLRPILSGDPDALRYIAAVQAADQQSLEPAVRKAITDFVTGCKSDGIWNAIKASCILAGARTLSGALVPLKGTAPTNNNFVSGDYSRETGLVGNASNKHLASGFSTGSLTSSTSGHLSVYASTALADNHSYSGANAGSGFLVRRLSGNISVRMFTGADVSVSSSGDSTGFIGASRPAGTNVNVRVGGSTSTLGHGTAGTLTSSTEVAIFGFNNGGSIVARTDARLAFYSIGDDIDLAALDTRVSALITAIGNS